MLKKREVYTLPTMKRIIPSIPDFRDFILSNNYFVDKTLFIKEWFCANAYVSLMPRPKRFGKTLNLSMIEHFFDIRRPENKDLFAEFKISEDKEFCKENQNKYPVISLTFKGIKDNSWEACLNKLAVKVSDLYQKHDYLLNSTKLSDFDKENCRLLINLQASKAQLEYSLLHLSKFLYKHYDKKVIILVDEYDAPIINAFNNTPKPIKSEDKANKTYYQKVVNFMQTFLGEAFKDNVYLHRGLITGVLRISRESLFSEWNNVSVFDIKTPFFTDSFGFTQTEVEQIIKYFGLSKQKMELKHWYDGYKFGETTNIYNPWSIVNYVAFAKAGFKPYWVNSSDYSLIQSRITEPKVKETIEKLISGKTILKTIKENFVFEHFESNSELVWTLLFYSGFLTQTKAENNNLHELLIPNNEVKILFTDIILSWIQDQYNIKESSLKTTINHLINNDLDGFDKGLKEVMQDSISYFDTAQSEKPKNEQIFHIYTLGLLAILSTDYVIKSNRESGEGRYDIMLVPRNRELNSIIIEIKSIEAQKINETDSNFAKRVNSEIKKALNQIEKKQYDKELIISKIPKEKIIKVPIVFAGKTPFVEKIKVKKTKK